MNPNYNQTITIYNCLHASDNSDSMKDIWQKTTLHNCFYKNVIGQVETTNGIRMANAYTVRIPQSDVFKPYHEWKGLSAEERSKYFTCSLKDIIVKGECSEELTGISPATASEFLNRHKPDAFVVTAFSDNTSHKMAKHYRIGG